MEENAELRRLVAEAWLLQTQIKDKSQQLRALEEKHKEYLFNITTILENTESDGVIVGDVICTKVDKEKVSISSEPDERREFFEYLEEIQMLEQLMTVNHARLQSFWADQKELAESRGEEPKIPGLNSPFKYSTVTLKLKK